MLSTALSEAGSSNSGPPAVFRGERLERFRLADVVLNLTPLPLDLDEVGSRLEIGGVAVNPQKAFEIRLGFGERVEMFAAFVRLVAYRNKEGRA